MKAETDQIKALWEQLSKTTITADVGNQQRTSKRGSSKASVRAGDAPSDRVVQPPKDSTSTRSRRRSKGVVETPKLEAHTEEDVRREVLPAGSVHDTRGPADEHTAEGPESGGGTDAAGGERDSGSPVRED